MTMRTCILCTLLWFTSASAQVYTIRTLAGTGTFGFSGDGGAATAATLHSPWDVITDTGGNVFFTDSGTQRVRRIERSGIITTVAGTGVIGFGGEGGPATNALLKNPAGLAVDGSGNLYVADAYNDRVRRISPTGTIVTIAGNGSWGRCADGMAATLTCLGNPMGIAFDSSGRLYVSESTSSRVRRIRTDGTFEAVAGSGVFGLSGDNGPAANAAFGTPLGISLDSAGNLYIADRFTHSVRRVTPSGVVTTVAGTGVRGYDGDGGPATAARLDTPHDVAVDAAGNLYIADTGNHRIRRVSSSGVITTIAGDGSPGLGGDGGTATSARLNQPRGVAVDGEGKVYVADWINHSIRVLLPDAGTCIPYVPGSLVRLPAGSGTTAFQVSRSPACGHWSAASNDPWLIATGSGGGDGTVQLSYSANPGSTQRSGTVIVAGQPIMIVQDPQCAVSVSGAATSPVQAGGATGRLTVTPAGLPCAWVARSNEPWVEVFPTPGTGAGTVGLTIYPNFSARSRSATVSIGQATVTVTQEGMAGSLETRFIRRIYFNALRRLPTEADVSFLITNLRSGTRGRLILSILDAPEFRAGGGFVTGLYRVLLGRVPELGGWAFQLNSVLTSGRSQESLAAGFLDSPEWVLKQGPTVGDEPFVRLLFVEILGRQPSSAEIAFQLPYAANRGQLTTNFLGVPEFWVRNAPLLSALHAYFVVLGRDPRPDERTALETRLRSGTPLLAVLEELVESVEHNSALQ